MQKIDILEKISKVSLYVLTFLMPLWFMPVTQDPLQFQKQILFILLTLLVVIPQMARAIIKGSFSFRMSWLNVMPLLILVVYGVTTALSKWRYASFWGLPLNVADNFLTILFFALFYFALLSLENSKQVIKLLVTFSISMLVANVYMLLQLYHLYLIPVAFAKNNFFNTIGSVNIAAIVTAILLPFLLAMGFAHKDRKRWLLWALTGVFFLFLLVFNFIQAWITLSLGLFVFLLFSMLKLRENMDVRWISFPMVMLVVALFFIFFRIHIPGTPTFPVEVMPSYSYEMQIIKDVYKKDFLFGYGPGTFQLAYAKFHPSSINQTIFWGTRFLTGSSEVLDWFLTKGLIGGIIFLAMIAMGLFFAFSKLMKFNEKDEISWLEKLGISSAFLAMAVANFLYYSNFTMAFLFWLLLAGLATSVASKKKEISIAAPSISSVVFSFIFLMALIFSAGILFIGGQKYIAEAKYLSGANAIARGDFDKGSTKILSAASLNPSMDLYWRDLSQVYLSQINSINQNQKLNNDDKSKQIQAAIVSAVNAVNRSVTVAPLNVANWNVRGFVFRNLIGFQGADTLAIDSYNQAIQLEPSSPFAFTELGRVYLTEAQALGNDAANKDIKKNALDKALDNLNKAIALKKDYSPAHYLIALVYGEQGKSQDEITKLEETKQIAPQDKGLAFQLGVLYYQNGQNDKAQGELERARTLDPNYANARYMLGLVYDKQGKTQQALDEFNKVLELNPGNTDVQKIINNLKAGKPALSGIQQQPIAAPVSDTPPEINQDKTK